MGFMNGIRNTIAFSLIGLLARSAVCAQVSTSGSRPEVMLSGGLGSLRVSYPEVQGIVAPSDDAITLGAMVSYPLGDRFRVGVEGVHWSGSAFGLDRRVVSAAVVGTWYPLAAARIRLEAGPGYSWFREKLETSSSSVTARAFALRLGVAYDVPVGHRFAILPFVRASFATTTESSYEGAPATEIATRLWHVGISAAWH
jgi:hypothetical protein